MTCETPCDVDAAGGDVGGDEHPDLVLAELGERLLAGHLGHVAVQRAGVEAALGEVVGDPLRLPLGAGEDDDLVGVLGLQDPADDLRLVEVVGLVDELRGRRHQLGVVRRLGADVHRVPHVGAGQRRRSRPAWSPRTASSGGSRASCDRMRSTSGRKPRSSISSASSRTSACTWERSSARRLARSMSRPGVPTTMSTPALERVELARRSRRRRRR